MAGASPTRVLAAGLTGAWLFGCRFYTKKGRVVDCADGVHFSMQMDGGEVADSTHARAHADATATLLTR